ncbi:MAG: hypothetical protein ABIJ45_00890 [Candidatus Zixiibacteriota bacterium]
MKSTRMIVSAIVLPMIVLMISLMGGCDSSSNDGTSSLAINVTATPTSTTVNGTSIIEALITSDGTALAGRVIVFSVSPNLGTFSQSVDTSGLDGSVVTTFTALSEGTAIIRAFYSSAVVDSVSVTISDGGGTTGGSGNLSGTATPTSILANGVDTSVVAFTVLDAYGDPAPESTVVILAAGEKFQDINGDGLFTNGVDSVIYDLNANGTWDAAGSIPSMAYTAGATGIATVYYISGTTASTVYIRATCLTSGYEGYEEITIYTTPDAHINSIVMSVETNHLAVKGTGGMETAMLYATGYDYNGNAVPEGLPIDFLITDGPDPDTTHGEHLGNLEGVNRRGPYTATTNGSGVASCPISSGEVSGTIRVRCIFEDTVISEATQILVHAGPPANIVAFVEECNVQYWGLVNETNDVGALVYDIYNNPCTDSTVVYFTCSEGVMMAHLDPIEAEDGLAASTWMSYGNEPGDSGLIFVVAETNGGSLLDTVSFLNTWYPYTMVFDVFPTSIPADNKSKRYMVVSAYDLNDHYITDLAPVKLSGDFINFTDRENCDGCYCSNVSANMVAGILDEDYSMTGGDDNGIGAVVIVTARYPGWASVSQAVNITTGAAYSNNCSITVNGSAAAGETLPITVLIMDRAGNPLGDHSITVTASGGVVTAGSQSTNSYGEAFGFTWTAPGAPGDYTIVASDLDPGYGGITLTASVTVE